VSSACSSRRIITLKVIEKLEPLAQFIVTRTCINPRNETFLIQLFSLERKVMIKYTVHTLKSAPEASKKSLEALQSAFGFIPNIAAAMSASPVLIDSLVPVFGNVHGGSFSEPQIQTVLLTNAVTNASTYPVALHTFLALNNGVLKADVDAIRKGDLPEDAKLAALSRLAKTLIEKRGRLNDHDKEKFLQAGFSPEHLLEVIAIVAASTITNYTSSVAEPPLESDFQVHSWSAN
jgi:alkylhydroperoxidase family enzyme